MTIPTIRLRFSPDTPRLKARVSPSIPPLQAAMRNNGTAIQWQLGVGGAWVDLLQIEDINATVTVGTTTTLDPGEPATVENVGTAQDAVLNFGIPVGFDGQVVDLTGGTGLDVDATDPAHPIVGLNAASQASLALADSSVQSVVAGSGIDVDATDPNNPTVSTVLSDFWLTVVAATTAAASWLLLLVLGHLTSRTLIKALMPSVGMAVYLSEEGREGTFICRVGTAPVSDPNEGAFLTSTTSGYYWERAERPHIDVKWCGALADEIALSDAAITAAAYALTSAAAIFTSADIGKRIAVAGAGAAGGYLVTTIAAFVSANQVTLTAAASTTVSGAYCQYGTNDAPAISAAIALCNALGGGTVFAPAGRYLIGRTNSSVASGVILKSSVWLCGAGEGSTFFMGTSGTSNLHLMTTEGVDNHDIVLSDFTVDHNGGRVTGQGHAIRFSEAHRAWCHHLAVKNSIQHGIVSITSTSGDLSEVNSDFFIDDCYFENIGIGPDKEGDAIRIFYGAGRTVVDNIIVKGATLHAIHAAKGIGIYRNIIATQCAHVGCSPEAEGDLISGMFLETNMTCDLLANRPAPGNATAIFFASDNSHTYYDNGITWLDIGAGAPTMFWAITRSGGYDTNQKNAYSDIKIVLNVDEIEPYPGTTNDGFRLDASECMCSNILVKGPFRFGIYSTEPRNVVSGCLVEGAYEDGIRFDGGADYNVISNWTVVSAGLEGSGYNAINIRNSDGVKIIGGSALDTTNIYTAINEYGTTDNSIIAQNHLLTSGGPTIAKLGANTRIADNIGYTTEAVGAATIPGGSTNVTVTHGLSRTPAAGEIMLTAAENPTNDPGILWISNITSTQFRINCRADPGASNLDVNWLARLQ